MKPEDKELLLQDLCARLPYGVICKFTDTFDGCEVDNVLHPNDITDMFRHRNHCDGRIDVKPYLRPLSSMTEEEHNEWFNYYHEIELKEAKSTGDYLKAAILGESASIDWLNKKMFDFRGLIPKDLAIAVTEDNNPYKKV
jgi:hypothetical protein